MHRSSGSSFCERCLPGYLETEWVLLGYAGWDKKR